MRARRTPTSPDHAVTASSPSAATPSQPLLAQRRHPFSASGAARRPAHPRHLVRNPRMAVPKNLLYCALLQFWVFDLGSRVSINPESKSRAVNREVLSELIKLHGKTSLGGKLPAYDGRKSLYTAGSLPFESEEFSVTLVDPEKKDKEKAEREYKITIRIAGRTDLYHLQQFLKGRQRDMPQETIQVLDVVLRESPSWNYVTVSRSFFSTTFGHRGDIGEGLECWRGYYQSLRPTQMGLSLNIDISATSFFKPVTVVQFVLEFLNLRDASRPLTDRDRIKIKKALRGVRVETNHQEDQIRRYKITGITPVPMSQLIFPVDERGTRMSVVHYFMQRYNYNLQYTSWPCLQSGSDARPVYLPMEACKIVEGQRYSKKLNDKQVANILRATCQRPQQREQSIREMVLHNKYAEDKFAQEFGINVCSDLVSVPARVLPPPMLRYHDSGKEKTCAPSVGQWNMINKKMINGGIIDNWACVSFSRMRPEEVHRFCCDLIQMCNMTGMSVNSRPLVDNRSASPNHIENALRDVYRRTTEMLSKQGHEKQLQLLIVILPEISGSYGKIKKVCETDLGIVSQCYLPRYAARPNKQYLENVALKINVKVGLPPSIEKAFARFGVPAVTKVPTIIFGADVTHPPPGEDSTSSIAVVVASMDWPEITKYRGLVSAQPHRQEIIEDLFSVSKDPQRGNVNGGMIRELLIAFRWKTGRRPERILFYRDSVSEGQLSTVRFHEMNAIRKACAALEEGHARCTRGVSVVPPAYNADLAAFRPRYYVEGDSSDGGSTPRSSRKKAILGEGPVEVPNIKENDVMSPVSSETGGVLHLHTTNIGTIREILIAIRRKTGRRPDKIIFHSDREDEEHPSLLLVSVYGTIREACTSLDEGYVPLIVIDDSQEKNRSLSPDINEKPENKSASQVMTHLTVDSPIGPIPMQIDLNSKSYKLKQKLEEVLDTSLEHFYMRGNGITLKNNDPLKTYGLRDNSTIQLLPRLLGGCRRGSKRPRMEPEPPKLLRLKPLTQQFTLTEYVDKFSQLFFARRTLPHPEIANQEQVLDYLTPLGRILGNSIARIFGKAQATRQSWNGEIGMKDFVVINGRAVLRENRQPTVRIDWDSILQRDDEALDSILTTIYVKPGINLQYMDDFLSLLKDPECTGDWMARYKRNSFAFKSPHQIARIQFSLLKLYDSLSDSKKIEFQKVVNRASCLAWPAAKNNYVFNPQIVYMRDVLHRQYPNTPWGCFKLLRNYETHGRIFPVYFTHVPVPQILGNFVAKVIQELLKDEVNKSKDEDKFDIEEAITE
ncbi:hypothetical protein VPH35_093243 [Triticum aestivum]